MARSAKPLDTDPELVSMWRGLLGNAPHRFDLIARVTFNPLNRGIRRWLVLPNKATDTTVPELSLLLGLSNGSGFARRMPRSHCSSVRVPALLLVVY